MADASLVKVNGKITEPITTFINKISVAIGGGFRPRQIRRVAEAEADASVIKAQAEGEALIITEKAKIKANKLNERALIRFVAEETKKQDNIESITEKAIPQLTSSSTPQDMENDWIMNFFDKCRIVSDDEMQLLWSKLLAGEANTPGTFSKRTVNFVASLDKSDAVLFTKLCAFNWVFGNVETLIYDTEASIYTTAGITFGALMQLDEIGLITYETHGFNIKLATKRTRVHYYGKPIIIEFKEDKNGPIKIGKVLLSLTGKELAFVCNSKPVDGFTEYVLDNWRKQGFIVSSP